MSCTLNLISMFLLILIWRLRFYTSCTCLHVKFTVKFVGWFFNFIGQKQSLSKHWNKALRISNTDTHLHVWVKFKSYLMGFLLGTVFPILLHSAQTGRTIWWVSNVSLSLSTPTSAQISGCTRQQNGQKKKQPLQCEWTTYINTYF